MYSLFKQRNIALDLGNSNTLVADGEKVLLSQPSCIVFTNVDHKVKAIGDEAYRIFEKAHDEFTAIKPLKDGVIADFDSARAMIRAMVDRVYGGSRFFSGFNRVISGVPYSTTEVERRALRDAIEQFNPRKRNLIYEPLAAALGMDLNIQEPNGKMVIDMGGGITEIVIISLSGIAEFESVKVAGDTFDMNIQDHFRRYYNMSIGLKTAEQVKLHVGAVTDDLEVAPDPYAVKGKDMVSGLPVTRKITSGEVALILDKSVTAIESAIVRTLEKCPPELAADIYQNGIYITGGSSMLRGIKTRFEKSIGLSVHLDKQPLSSVSRGIAKTLVHADKYFSVLVS
jgi:rod shape-determining protein MreB and related proteins